MKTLIMCLLMVSLSVQGMPRLRFELEPKNDTGYIRVDMIHFINRDMSGADRYAVMSLMPSTKKKEPCIAVVEAQSLEMIAVAKKLCEQYKKLDYKVMPIYLDVIKVGTVTTRINTVVVYKFLGVHKFTKGESR